MIKHGQLKRRQRLMHWTSTQIGCRVWTAAVTHPILHRGDSAASRPIIFGLTADSNTDDQTINALIGTTGSIRFKEQEAQRESLASNCSDGHMLIKSRPGCCGDRAGSAGQPGASQRFSRYPGTCEMLGIRIHQCYEYITLWYMHW